MRIKTVIELEINTVFEHDGPLPVYLAESVAKKAISGGITTSTSCDGREYTTAIGKVKVRVVKQWTAIKQSVKEK